MTIRIHPHRQEVAGSRLATSAQPPRATSTFAPTTPSQPTPQPTRSFVLLDKPDALLEGLHCSTASRPLLTAAQIHRKTTPTFPSCKERLQ